MDKKQIIEDYLQGRHPMEQQSWEMPSADELERDEALFDSLMAKKKASSSLTPRPLRGERELKRRRLWPWAGWIAASIVIAFIFWPNSSEVVEQPVVAEVTEQPAPEAPKASDYSENSDYSDYSDKSEHSEPIKAKRTYKSRKVSKPQEEPLLAQADPLPEEPVISTQTAEPAAEYQSVQTIRVAPDQVVFNVQTADMPMMANMPSVGELRARGQQLLANVQQQINEASKQF